MLDYCESRLTASALAAVLFETMNLRGHCGGSIRRSSVRAIYRYDTVE